jgi:hypothetical protein
LVFPFYRSTPSEQQDLDLTSEPLNAINQRLTNSSTPTRSVSFKTSKNSDLPSTSTSPSTNVNIYQEPIIGDSRSRHNAPLTSTTNKIYSINQSNSRFQHLGQSNMNTQKNSSIERDRIFVHHSDSRPFVLGAAIQMKPINDNILLSNEKHRPCHRQNALRYKSNEQERQSRISTPIITHHNPTITNMSRYQSIERCITPSPQPTPIKSFSCDINHGLHPSDISWSVREKAKLFEHKLSTGRENYV